MNSTIYNNILVCSNKHNLMQVIDPSSGTILYSYKNCFSSLNGTAILPNPSYIVSIQDDKLLINIWKVNNDIPLYKCHIAEKMGPICISYNGNFLFGGSISGKCYVWDILSGELLNVWDAHYKAITSIEITDDGSFLITAGEDAIINVWNLIDILDINNNRMHSTVTAFRSWSEHHLKITKLCISKGGIHGKIYSSSLDKTCKIFEISAGKCLLSIDFPSFLTNIIVDNVENTLYVASGNGIIYTIDLSGSQRYKTSHSVEDIHNNSYNTNNNNSNNSNNITNNNKFIGHERQVNTLCISECGLLLISGDAIGKIKIWDIITKQCLRTIDNIFHSTIDNNTNNNINNNNNIKAYGITSILLFKSTNKNVFLEEEKLNNDYNTISSSYCSTYSNEKPLPIKKYMNCKNSF